MLLKSLIKEVEVVQVIGSTNVDIEQVVNDCKSVVANGLYVCITGTENDGHNFVGQAEKYGAVAVVCERELDTSLVQVVVKNARKAMSIIAREFYGNACKQMKIIGVMGTNGKTTTSHLIYSLLNQIGIKCGLIGTLGAFFGEKRKETLLTTPDPIVLHKIFNDMYKDGVEIVVMEVSAHANYFDKLSGVDFWGGVFTNFSRDHLDFFKYEENYKKAKLKFFEENKCGYIITNSDDKLGVEIANKFDGCISYGVENPSDVFAIDIKENSDNTQFVINLFDYVREVETNLIGKFNVYNLLAATTTVTLLGVKPKKVVDSIKLLQSVSGRIELVYKKDFSVFLDYAHTPDGLEKVLSALRARSKARLICVFGCGGNRDSGKRYAMGEISAKNADFTIITTDNPRFEEPMEIIMQIEKGVLSYSKNYVIIQDRTQAIDYAINMAKKDDVILVAGKGSENYQEILGIKLPYNDKDTIRELLRSKLN